MIVHCPQCSARFNVDNKLLAPSGRSLRCSRCRASFFQGPETGPPPREPGAILPPHAAPPAAGEPLNERRRQERLFLHAKAELRLKKGLIFRGFTKDLNETGVTMVPDRPLEGVTIGDRGIFSFILAGGAKEFFTEFPCEVQKITPEGVYIHFYESSGSRPGTMRPGDLKKGDLELIKPGSQVAVFRQGGRVEEGWEVLPPHHQLPRNIQQVLELKEKEGSCVVCRKKATTPEGQDMYKVYFLLDLLAIQLQIAQDSAKR